MVLPDVNVILQAYRKDSEHHELCHRWLEEVIRNSAHFGIAPQVLSSVVRLTTNPSIYQAPDGVEVVLDYCNTILSRPNCVSIIPGAEHWEIFCRLCRQTGAQGNFVPDAWFAALAIESGCEWVSLDTDFSRFPDLRWRRPTLVD